MKIVSIAERPDLWAPADRLASAAWPEFMKHDAVAVAGWPRLPVAFPQHQLCGLSTAGEVIAVFNAVPVPWDAGGDFPGGLDAALEAAFAEPAGPARVLCALSAVIAPGWRGGGLSAQLLRAARANADGHGLAALIAPVRPTAKAQYPLIPFADYVAWRDDEGLPFDPWIRLHHRLGARVHSIAEASMLIEGTTADWAAWTGLAFPQSGAYVVPGALVPVTADVVRDVVRYVEPNLWMVHP